MWNILFVVLVSIWLATTLTDLVRSSYQPNTIQLISIGIILVVSLGTLWMTSNAQHPQVLTRYGLYALLVLYMATLITWGVKLTRKVKTADTK